MRGLKKGTFSRKCLFSSLRIPCSQGIRSISLSAKQKISQCAEHIISHSTASNISLFHHALPSRTLFRAVFARSHRRGRRPDDPNAFLPADLPSGISTSTPHLRLLLPVAKRHEGTEFHSGGVKEPECARAAARQGNRSAVDEECALSPADLPSAHQPSLPLPNNIRPVRSPRAYAMRKER